MNLYILGAIIVSAIILVSTIVYARQEKNDIYRPTILLTGIINIIFILGISFLLWYK